MRSWRSFAWLWPGCWGLWALACSRALPETGKSAALSASSALPVASSPALLVSNAGPGTFELRAVRPVQVAMVAQLEQRTSNGGWVLDPAPDDAPGYLLSESCPAKNPPACRSLIAGETLVPVPWSGADCSAQCGKPCEPEARFRPGEHRLVVTACAPPHERFEGPPFAMPASAKALARLRAATGVDHVRAARLDNRSLKLPYEANEPGRIAGYKEISGTSQELAPELTAELLQWLRADAGFNDRVLRRCVPDITVGFVLTRKAPSRPQRTDIDVDLGCRALDIIQNGEHVSFSYFDFSREQLFDILTRVLPNDRQLRREIDRQLSALARLNGQPTRAAHSP